MRICACFGRGNLRGTWNTELCRFLTKQMEFNSKLLKLNDDADIMEEFKGLTPEQLKALIAMVKKS